MPDEDLLPRAVSGDHDALTALLKRHGPKARHGLAGRIPLRWQALLSEDDVMQQTYADAIVKIGQFSARDEPAFTSWLTTIARRNLSDAIKELQREKRGGSRRQVALGPDESALDLFTRISGTGTSPSNQAARAEAIAALRRAISELPEVYERAIRMYDLEGRPVEEVARALGRSRGAFYMVLARARERLREIIGDTPLFLSNPS